MTNVERPIVLGFVKYYVPSFKSGGPVRSVANIVKRLGDQFAFRIVCQDRDSFDRRPFEGIAVEEWNQIGHAEVFYVSPVNRRVTRFRVLMKSFDYDLVYLNSFFDFYFTILPMTLLRLRLVPVRPVVIAPRGEFSPGALALSRIKKKAFILMMKLTGLYYGVTWQASSEREAADIRAALGRNIGRVVVAPNLSDATEIDTVAAPEHHGESQPFKVVFLSRISRKKNLDFALRVLSMVKSTVVFHVYGSVSDAHYWVTCQKLVRELPANVSFEYKGSIDHETVVRTLSSYDLFMLPTKGENYGHVILEALLAGTPVLLSDTTPWCDIERVGVGWVRRLDDLQGFIDVIEKLRSEPVARRVDRRKRVAAHGQKIANDKDVERATVRLFQDLLQEK